MGIILPFFRTEDARVNKKVSLHKFSFFKCNLISYKRQHVIKLLS